MQYRHWNHTFAKYRHDQSIQSIWSISYELWYSAYRVKETPLCFPPSIPSLLPFVLRFTAPAPLATFLCGDGWVEGCYIPWWLPSSSSVYPTDRRWQARKATSQLARLQGCGNKHKQPCAPTLYPNTPIYIQLSRKIRCKTFDMSPCGQGVFSSLHKSTRAFQT